MVGAANTHTSTGVILRPHSLLDGIWFAMMGLVTEPIWGLRNRGLTGMVHGLGTAISAIPLKPIVGSLASLSQATSTIAASLDTSLDGAERKLRMRRVRPPRYFRVAGSPILCYRSEENRGEELISRLRRGRHLWESHVHHCEVCGDKTLLVTRRRLVVLRANPFLAVDWEVMLDDILLLNLGHDLLSMEIIHLPARPSPKPNTGFALSSSLVKGRGRSFNEYRASVTLGQGLSTKTNVLYMADERVSIQLCQVLLKLVPSLRTPVLDQLFTPQS